MHCNYKKIIFIICFYLFYLLLIIYYLLNKKTCILINAYCLNKNCVFRYCGFENIPTGKLIVFTKGQCAKFYKDFAYLPNKNLLIGLSTRRLRLLLVSRFIIKKFCGHSWVIREKWINTVLIKYVSFKK